MRRAAMALVAGVLLAGCGSGTHRAVPTPRPAPPPSTQRTTPHPTRSTVPSLEPSTVPPKTTTPAAPKPSPVQKPSPAPTLRPAPVIAPVSAADLGGSWHPGCPVAPAGLRAITVRYLGFDHTAHTGRLVAAAGVAPSVVVIFRKLYAAGFPIRHMVPISAYAGDDERSMEADNSSAYNCRPITGGTGWSQHAYGTAIDLNPLENPYVSGSTFQPRTARPFLDRTRSAPGMIHPGDPIVGIFARRGWSWGGNWPQPQDYQHFQT